MSLGKYGLIFRFAKRYWQSLLLILVLTALSSIIAALQPWPLKFMVDSALGSTVVPSQLQTFLSGLSLELNKGELILFSGFLALGVFATESTVETILVWMWGTTGQGMVYELSQRLFQRFQRLSLLFHQERGVGDLLSRLTEDTYSIYTLTNVLFVAPIHYAIALVTMGTLAWKLNSLLTVLCFAVSPMMALSGVVIGAKLKRRGHLSQEAKSDLTKFVHQTLTSIPIVQVFHTTSRNRKRFSSLAHQVVNHAQWDNLLTSGLSLVNGSITTISRSLILFVGGQQVLQGSMTIGSLIIFLAYLESVQNSLQELLKNYGQFKSAEASLERLDEILKTEPLVCNSPNMISVALPVKGDIQFCNVNFNYQPDQTALEDINLQVSAGESIALVGTTGSGKSTLLSLIPRFFDPSHGSILLDGIDIRQIAWKTLRSQISLVLQDPFLLPFSIADNIAYGDPSAKRSEIIQAAELANADEFIRQLPQGYDTIIGESGAILSGGQKQRISIARALLKNAPILLLDEPTSALDVSTEASIMTALQQLMQGRTTFIIAHRLSTIQNADRIVVLEQGRVREIGNHQSLLAHKGAYYQLYSSIIQASQITLETGQ